MVDLCTLARIAEGKSGAVEECLDRFGGLVWSMARRLSATESEAEDAVQEIFVEIWRSAGRFDPKVASETTFVAMIARRRLIDRLRRSNRSPSISSENDEIQSNVDEARNIETNDEAIRALKHLSEMPSDQSKVILLAVYHGMSHAKIAEVTGMPLGTVKTKIRRGLTKLREALLEGKS